MPGCPHRLCSWVLCIMYHVRMHEQNTRIDLVAMLPILDPENKPFSTSDILNVIMTSLGKAAKFIKNVIPDPENISVDIKIMILCVLQVDTFSWHPLWNLKWQTILCGFSWVLSLKIMNLHTINYAHFDAFVKLCTIVSLNSCIKNYGDKK